MKASVLCLLAAVTLAGLCGVADAEIRIELKSAARLSSGEIRLGQVAAVSAPDPALAESVAAISLGSTPWPGSVRAVSRNHIAMRLSRGAINPAEIDWQGARACAVTVRAVRITGEEIVKVAHDYLRTIPVFQKDGVEIAVESVPRPKQIAADARPVLVPSAPSVVRSWGRIKVYVRVMAGNRLLAIIPVTFKVTCPQRVFFAARPIRRGQTIAPSDVQPREIVLGPTSGELAYAVERNDVIGKKAVRSVSVGTPLTVSMVADPLAARRGEGVSVYVRSQHIEVSTRGIAQSDAHVGDMLEIMIAGTGKVVSGKVIGPGAVELPL